MGRELQRVEEHIEAGDLMLGKEAGGCKAQTLVLQCLLCFFLNKTRCCFLPVGKNKNRTRLDDLESPFQL